MRSPAAAGAAMSALIRDVGGPPACTNATLIAPCQIRRRATEVSVAACGDRALTRPGRLFFPSVPCPRSLRVHPQLRDAGCPKTSPKSTARESSMDRCHGHAVAPQESRTRRVQRGPGRPVRRAQVRCEEDAPVPQPSRGPCRPAGQDSQGRDRISVRHERLMVARICCAGRSHLLVAQPALSATCPAMHRRRRRPRPGAIPGDATRHRSAFLVAQPLKRIPPRLSAAAMPPAMRHPRSRREPRRRSHAQSLRRR